MADSVWFEVTGDDTKYPNVETAKPAAKKAAQATDGVIEVYRCTRTLVRTVQRTVTVTETDVPA